jgi:hypothetical protein
VKPLLALTFFVLLFAGALLFTPGEPVPPAAPSPEAAAEGRASGIPAEVPTAVTSGGTLLPAGEGSKEHPSPPRGSGTGAESDPERPDGVVPGPAGAAAGRDPADPVEPGAVVLSREQLLLGPGLEGAKVAVMLRPLDGSGPVVEAEFGEDGTAALPAPGLAAGLYEAEVSALKDGVLVRVKHRIRVGEGPADLGGLEVSPGAGVRARVVDEEGTVLPQAGIVVVRPEEEPGQGRRFPPGEGGWVTFADLEPGVDHRVVVFGLPEPLERVVRVPPRAKAVAELEIRWPARIVPVTLALTGAEGEALAPATITLRVPATGHEWTSPLPLPGGLVPGDYEVRAGDLRGRLSVPAVTDLELTVALR